MTKSTKWFLGILALFSVLAVVAIAVLVSTIVSLGDRSNKTVTYGNGEKLAVIELRGVITSSDDIVRQFKKYREDSDILGIVLRIESPGGGVVASQEIYEEVRKTRDEGKPVVVSMGSIAASGGFYVACGASKLVGNQGTLTGSIGVIAEFTEIHEALNKLGIGINIVKSGKLKDAGTVARDMTPEDREYFQGLMDDVHHQFMDVVERERSLSHEEVAEIADGRVFTGVQAVELGLIDTLGTFEEAIMMAADMAGIEGEPSLVRERRSRSWWSTEEEDVSSLVRQFKNEVLNRPGLSYRYTGPY